MKIINRFGFIGLCLIVLITDDAWARTENAFNKSKLKVIADRKPDHPLEPLNAAEIRKTHQLIAAQFNPSNGLPNSQLLIPILTLKEPEKAIVLDWQSGKKFPRVAYADILHYPSNRLWQATIDLDTETVTALELKSPGTQPAIAASEYTIANKLVHAYQPWKDAMAQRGVDPDKVYVDLWSPGDVKIPDGTTLSFGKQTRLMQALAFFRDGDPDAMDNAMPQNPYDRPIEGVVATIDLNALKVVNMTNTLVRPVSDETGNTPNRRADLKPLNVIQPQGPSFEINGHQVHWQKWHFFVYLVWC
jgi:primary-amine oxidase